MPMEMVRTKARWVSCVVEGGQGEVRVSVFFFLSSNSIDEVV